MKKINLKDYYSHITVDTYIDIPDEVFNIFEEYRKAEQAYQSRIRYHKAYYSLDRGDGIEHTAFFELIDTLPVSLDKGFKKAILSLNKYKKGIINALKYPYSNGKLEGKNNLIKVIKRIAFGFRTFRHLRMRVLIQQNLCEII
ncbi:transposase [Enterococcus faecalis]|uniref:transposase n=1 Tax=Enterococcus faecalis TaxID=1351 RepID=UPI000CF1998B|nr:transposase [Enterococcus faecalis]EME5464079.1 transposase [Enterococcus faecalis]EME5464566.1 transposase [Enterococcus faecalis]PQC42899.1 hypothetical protein CUM89_10565 [Enterococcus faecalis]PQG00437.1 hypothetical protein CUS50_00135 [Enterococcus faecalis]